MNILFTTHHEKNKLKTKQEAIDKRIKKSKRMPNGHPLLYRSNH